MRAALLLVALAAPLSAGVHVVDAAGGGDFTSIVAAVGVAVDGDLILVRAGDYPAPVVVSGKSLTIAADGSGPVATLGVLVGGLVAGKRVVLRGLSATGAAVLSPIEQGLRVDSGEVWAEDCRFAGAPGVVTIGAGPGFPGVAVASGAHVVLLRCEVQGGAGPNAFSPYSGVPGRGGYGLSLSGGRADVYGGSLRGGRGGDIGTLAAAPGPGGNGGAGLWGTAATVLVAGVAIAGGDAGDGDQLVPSAGWYVGGDAIELLGASALRRRDGTLQAGAGGLDGSGGQGPAGALIDVPFGSVAEHVGGHRDYALGAPTPEGGVLQLSYAGAPGDLFSVYVDLSPAWLPLPGKQGTWHLSTILAGPITFGPVSAPDGRFELAVPIPELGLSETQSLVLFEQVFVKPLGEPTLLGSPSVHVIVGSGP